eukprot:15444942-Alexandrium_andersonii.AAC.1
MPTCCVPLMQAQVVSRYFGGAVSGGLMHRRAVSGSTSCLRQFTSVRSRLKLLDPASSSRDR